MKNKTRDKKTTTTAADDASAFPVGTTQATEIVTAIMDYEGRRDLADGVLTLPVMRPFTRAYLFRLTLDRLADELRQLRNQYDCGRGNDGDQDASELEPETFAGAVLESLASWLSCAAEDGTWWDETFDGARANLRAELQRGVQSDELQLIKDHPAIHWSAEAYSKRVREGRVQLVRDTLKATPLGELMTAQGFPAIDHDRDGTVAKHMADAQRTSIAWTSPPCEVVAKSTVDARKRQRVERAVESFANGIGATVLDAGVEGRTEWLVGFEVENADGSLAGCRNVVLARSDREARDIVGKGYVGKTIRIHTVQRHLGLSGNADDVFHNVLTAMQDADELGGPTHEDYIELMQKISEEAIRRRDVCNANLLATKGAH